jgi:pimeloyl-ACP methyl ester carboxylesterase
MAGPLPRRCARIADMTQPRPVVLVHGALHGAWCWAALQAELDLRGVPSLAIDLPGHGASLDPLADLHGDAAAVAAVVERIADEVVLVGHSYGGAVISQAGTTGRVSRLVFLSALVLDVGENAADLMASLPPGEGVSRVFIRNADGTLGADPTKAVDAFYGTCSPEFAAAAVARLSPQRAATLKQPASVAAWRSLPSTFIRCLQDRALTLPMQDALAVRCTDVASLDCDHSPFASCPSALADLLVPLANR